jgi:hypothetical protein
MSDELAYRRMLASIRKTRQAPPEAAARNTE